MKVKIKETGEIRELNYLIQRGETDRPQDWASEYVYDDENVSPLRNDEDDAEAQMDQETYEWWSDIFKCMEHCDEMMREIDSETLDDIFWSAGPDTYDLETYYGFEAALEREIKKEN